MRRGGKLAPRVAAAVARGVVEAEADLHTRGVGEPWRVGQAVRGPLRVEPAPAARATRCPLGRESRTLERAPDEVQPRGAEPVQRLQGLAVRPLRGLLGCLRGVQRTLRLPRRPAGSGELLD